MFDIDEQIKLKNGNTLEIHADYDAENPRNWDNLGEFYCFHNRYCLGDAQDFINPEDYNSFQEMIDDNTLPSDIVLPLYLYDHGNLALSHEPFHCPWDSGQVGFAVVPVNKIVAEYGDDSKKNREIALKVLISEIKTYHQYLSGQCYGYILKDEHGEEIDSCWGFYGYDHEKSGLLEYANIKEEVV